MMRDPRRPYLGVGPVRHKVPPFTSSASSADGDDPSFDNTNNKKKRKIPVSGASGASGSLEMAGTSSVVQSTDPSLANDRSGNVGQYYGSGSMALSSGSGVGIAGAGRGRYARSSGRPLHERRPLGASTNALNAFKGIPNRTRRDWNSSVASSAKGKVYLTSYFAKSY